VNWESGGISRNYGGGSLWGGQVHIWKKKKRIIWYKAFRNGHREEQVVTAWGQRN